MPDESLRRNNEVFLFGKKKKLAADIIHFITYYYRMDIHIKKLCEVLINNKNHIMIFHTQPIVQRGVKQE